MIIEKKYNIKFIFIILMIFILLFFMTQIESFDIKNNYRIIFIKTKEYILIYLKYANIDNNKIYKIYKNKL